MTPIGLFYSSKEQKYEAARQASVDPGHSHGIIKLSPGHNFEQALIGLEGFSKIWVLFAFHKNPNWNPMVLPPRSDKKVGVFATRSPHRPNGIGLSCVDLIAIRDLEVEVAGHDILNESPVLDIKPYIPYADSFPEAKGGWTEPLDKDSAEQSWSLAFTPLAEKQIEFLQGLGVANLKDFLLDQLSFLPTDTKRKRVTPRPEEGRWQIAYRTWRILYRVDMDNSLIQIDNLASGYTAADLTTTPNDPYGDKEIHRQFLKQF
jgi:tRNA-Thr(GGU) m(6)t(6)A37 methyltransferase TsaA